MRSTKIAIWVGLALAATACSKKDESPRPSCEAVYLDPSGGCSLGAISGFVSLAHGGPGGVPIVSLIELDGSVAASLEGIGPFEIPALTPGSYQLEAEAEGYVTRGGLEVEVVAGRTTEVAAIILAPADVERPSAIVGTILLRDAVDHGGIRVSLDDSTLISTTSSDGSFQIGDVEAGLRVLHARQPGYEDLDVEVVVAEGRDTSVDLEMIPLPQPGAVHGRVSSAAEGLPLEGIDILLGELDLRATTDAAGNYSIAGIPPGTYEVRAGLEGWLPSVAPEVVVEAGLSTELNFELEPGTIEAEVSGVARRMHAPANAHGGIVVGIDGKPGFETVTSANGSWAFEGVPLGLYSFTFTDDRLPALTLAGVTVHPGHNQVDVVLGPARRLANDLVASSRLFPSLDKALITFQRDPATYLYDAASDELQEVADVPLAAISVDDQARYATLQGVDALYRLDLADGSLLEIPGSAYASLVSDRGLTVLVGANGELYSLRAGEAALDFHMLPSSGSRVSVEKTVDEERGLRLLDIRLDQGGSAKVVVDFNGRVGRVSRQVVLGPDLAGFASMGSAEPVGFSQDLVWTGFEGFTESVITPQFHDARWPVDAASLLFVYDYDSDTGLSSVGVLDNRSGAVSLLVQGVHASFLGLTTMIASEGEGEPVHWITSEPPATGVVCAARQGDPISAGSMIACLDGPAPHALRLYDGESVEILSLDAEEPVFSGWGALTWRDSTGLLHIRQPWSASLILTIDCAEAEVEWVGGVASGTIAPLFLARCADPSPSYLLDFGAGTILPLPNHPEGCSGSPIEPLVACGYPCADGSCLHFLHDLGTGLSTQVGASAIPHIQAKWGSEGGVAIRLGGAVAYHGKRGASGMAPIVRACGITDPIIAEVEVDRSLWLTATGHAYLCSLSGPSSAGPFSPSQISTRRVGASSRVYVGGLLFDLADGSQQQLLSGRSALHPYANGLLITSAEGLLRIPEVGAPVWIVDDAEVKAAIRPHRGLLTFEVDRQPGYDLLVIDEDGSSHLLATHVDQLHTAGDRDLVFHDRDDRTASSAVTILDGFDARPILPRIATVEPWHLEGSRLFFNSPTQAGLSLIEVDLESASTSNLYQPAGGIILGLIGDARQAFFAADGWSWLESAPAPTAILAGPAERLEAASENALLFEAMAPEATYWLNLD